MPDIIVPSNTTPRAALGAGTRGETVTTPGVPLVYLSPIQVVGLNPMYDCSATECRENPINGCCNRLTYFAGDVYTNNLGTYENDVVSWLVDVSLYGANITTTAVWSLQKCSGADTWTTVGSLNGTTYGLYWALGSNTLNPTYTGVRVNMGRVYATHGRGIYRLRLDTSTRTIQGCLLSREFWVQPFDCDQAHGTVKFETFMSGQIGAYGRRGRAWSLCGFAGTDGAANSGWYDSVRLPGFFGYEKVPEYLEEYNEYQNGKMEQTSNEAIQSYEFISGMFDKELHDRLKVYGLMAEVRQVSDYNINNSDYNINQLSIKPNGPYEPTYFDKHWNNRQRVTVKFQNGYQSLIKSICCPSIR